MESAVVAAAALVLGWLLGIGSQFISAWFERKRRREERAENAARGLLGLFHQVRAIFRNAYRHDAEIDDNKLWELVGHIRQEIVLLGDPARGRLNIAADVLDDYWGAMQLTGATPARIAFYVCQEARESLRRILWGEPLAPLRSEVEEFRSSMVEYRTNEEEAMRLDAERRRR